MLPVELQEQRLGLAVFRNEADADAGIHRITRRREDHGTVIHANLATALSHAEQSGEQFELAHALQALSLIHI